jgi:hypothetical protein
MKLFNKNLTILFLLLIFFISCNKQKENQSLPEQTTENLPEIKLKRLERDLFSDKSKAGIAQFLANNPSFNKKYFGKFFPNDEITVKELFTGINNKSVDTLFQNSQEVFGEMEDIKADFAKASANVKANFPKHKVQEINTFISGMGFWGNDLYIDDSLIVISLDFFLGDKCKYEPQLPKYILKRYKKQNIVPFLMSLVANKYNQTDFLDNSLVAEMIYYGKAYYFLEKTMPQLADSSIAGYSNLELAEIKTHEKIIWAHFIEKNLLFETKSEISNKYVGERPNVPEIGTKCPGRVGRWVGWQIVKKYMEKNPDLTLAQLMAEKDARKIFNISKYKPE